MAITEEDTRPYSNSGCCTDRRSRDKAAAEGKSTDGYKACNASTCMQLPEGESCSTCVHETRCKTMFGVKPENTWCDFFPRRFLKRKEETEKGFVRVLADACKAIGTAAVAERLGVTEGIVQQWLLEVGLPAPEDRKRLVALLREGPDVERAAKRTMRSSDSPPPTVHHVTNPEPLLVLGPPKAKVADLTLPQVEAKLRNRGVFELNTRMMGDRVTLTAKLDGLREHIFEGPTLVDALETLLAHPKMA